MNPTRLPWTAACLATAGLLLSTGAAAISLPQRDDFQDGSTQGWTSGGANPNPPVQIADGGPQGAGDGYLLVRGNGLPGSGGNLVAFNTQQWAGDYAAAGVLGIRAQLRNLGTSDLVVRLLFEGPGGGFVTAAAASLPAGGGWTSAVWTLDLAEPALAGVTKLRMLHAPTADDVEPVEGLLGVDDVTALSGDACRDAGLSHHLWGLCHVYCDVLECSDGSPRRFWRACDRIGAIFERRSGSPPPCETDRDGDGVADDLDICPDDPDPDQADVDGDGFGDACDNCPDEFNPGQEDSFGDPEIGDACECPCFDAAEAEALVAALSDSATYENLECIDDRPTVKPLTFVRASRSDGLDCASSDAECSAISAEFTEDNACQLNAPAPAPQVLVGDISDAQREACRENILDAALNAGLTCN